MKNTSGISKDKSDRSKASAKKRYEISYKKALNSDYILNIDADKIKSLKEFMKEGGEVNFDKMKETLEKAQIAQDSVVYKYVELASEVNTPESYASAKAYLRAAVENYLERQYLSAVGRKRSDYINSVGVSDRNAIRGLLLYMALNLGKEKDFLQIK